MSGQNMTRYRLAASALALVASTAALAQSAPRPPLPTASEVTAAVSPAETVLSRTLFERQKSLVCSSGFCGANFVTVAAKHRYELQQLSCVLSAPSAAPGTQVTMVAAAFSASTGNFAVPLGLVYQAVVAAGPTVSTFQSSTSAFVPAGSVLSVQLVYFGTAPFASCQVIGQIVALK